jgi:uncharacterized protein
MATTLEPPKTATAPTTPVGPTEPQTTTFDNRFTRQFGVPAERVQKKVLPTMNEDVQDHIRRSPFLIMATSDAAGRCDASPKGGTPGFVRILDERRLLLPDVAGNKLFQGYQNVEQNAHVGLLFLIPGVDRTVRVNGRARILTTDEVMQHVAEPSLHYTDDNSILLQGMLIEVEESYSHCPRAFKFADLWNPETITANRT